MKRAENCQGAMVTHICVLEDSLCFRFSKSKGHQDGEEAYGPWHVYSNPFEPSTCAFLAMSRYLFTYPDILRNNSALFPGKDQYTRYCRIFAKLQRDHETELKEFGVGPEDLGTHSARKGVAVQSTAGTTVSPPLVSVALRMGWSLLGPCQARYLKYEQAGDRYLGRVAAGLDINDKKFAVSTYYFEASNTPHTDADLAQARLIESINKFLKDRLVMFEEIDEHTFHLIKSIFAAMCFHYGYIQVNTHQQCPFKSSTFFRDVPSNILQSAKVCYPWNKSRNAPNITGIPPHVILLAKVEELESKFERFKNELLEGVQTMLDARNVGTPEFYHHQVMNALQAATVKLTEEMRAIRVDQNHSSLNDSQAIDDEYFENSAFFMEDENEVPHTAEPEIGAALEESTQRQGMNDALARKRREESAAVMKKRKYRVGMFDSKLQILPRDYQFPKLTCFQLFNNWFLGNVHENIPPLRHLKHHHVGHVSGGKDTLRKMGQFMKKIKEISATIEDITWPRSSDKVSVQDLTGLWEKIGPELFRKYGKEGQARNSELSWRTMLNQTRNISRA